MLSIATPVRGVFGVLLATLIAAVLPVCSSPAASAEEQETLMRRLNNPQLGDLPALRNRRAIIVLVNYSKTNFFIDGPSTYGTTYEAFEQYKEYLNKDAGKTLDRVQIFYRPVPFDELLPALNQGLGDIAAAGLTSTPARQKLVTFTDPLFEDVNEILVSSKDTDGIHSIADLSGREV